VDLVTEAGKQNLTVIDYRNKWRHKTRRWARRELEDIKGLVVHQTAGGDSVDGLGRYHTSPGVHIGDKQGLPGIAYTLFVNKAGEVYWCNDLEDITWSHGDKNQPGDENKMFMGVCFGGKFRARGWPDGTEIPSLKQFDVFHKLWAFLKDIFALTDLNLYGHFDFGKPTCPGDDFRAVIEGLRKSVDHGLAQTRSRQHALKQLGYDPGVLDGIFGASSRHAMQTFQREYGIPVTAEWTNLTTAAAHRELKRRQG